MVVNGNKREYFLIKRIGANILGQLHPLYDLSWNYYDY